MASWLHPGLRKPALAYASGGRHSLPEGHPILRKVVAAEFLLAISLIIVIIGAATAQSQAGNDLSAHTAAVAQPAPADRNMGIDFRP
jgi:hypothetical protein